MYRLGTIDYCVRAMAGSVTRMVEGETVAKDACNYFFGIFHSLYIG